MPISEASIFYADTNKVGMALCKSDKMSPVIQSPYMSVQKSELYAILMVLLDFLEPFNIITDSIVKKSCSLYRNC